MGIENIFIEFIAKHHVMTLATVSEEIGLSCCSLFYVYIKSENVFVFSSSEETRHASSMLKNSKVAANILLETKVIGKLEGLQIEGEVFRSEESGISGLKKAYLKKYPFALVMDVDLWVLKPYILKLTDNKLGFGKKLLWSSLNDKLIDGAADSSK